MRVKLPEFQSKSDLFKYLVANEKTLISKKKSLIVYSDSVDCFPEYATKSPSEIAIKSAVVTKDDSIAEGVIRVKAVANASGFVDSHLDVLLPNSAKKTIRERKGIIPHLKDHVHRTDAEVGDVVDITLEDIDIKKLGYKNGNGTTQAIVFTTDIRKDYDEKIYNRYLNGKATQHSIGLQYVKIVMAINSEDEDYKSYKANWNKYYDQIINKEIVDETGYFWAVTEIKLIENSVVLFGSNEYTPTLEIATSEEPETKSTQTKPIQSITSKKRLERLKEIETKLKKLKN